ncbi:MAG: hypothetical protein U0638_02195 [Phycisphaerales bacterium]
MAVVTRLILVLMLVVQSLPGIAVERCAEMSSRAKVVSDSQDDEACPCCTKSGSGKSECTNGDAVSVCRCGMPKPEEPKSPPAEPKIERVQLFAAVLPTILSFSLPEPVPAQVRWDRVGGAAKRPTNSIQSVLCVWMV